MDCHERELRDHFPGVARLRPTVYLVTNDAREDIESACAQIEQIALDTGNRMLGIFLEIVLDAGELTRCHQGLVEYVHGGMYRVGQRFSPAGGVAAGKVVLHAGEVEAHLKPRPDLRRGDDERD